MDLKPTAGEDHLLIGWDEEMIVMLKMNAKKTPEKRTSEKVIKKVVEGDEKSLSSSDFHDVFDVNYTVPSRSNRKTKGDESSNLRIINVLTRKYNTSTELRRRLIESMKDLTS